MVGMLCTSKAGHDLGEVYVIVKEEQEYIYVADGRNKTIATPKRKNRKHIQIIKKEINQELTEKLRKLEIVRDEEIKRVITLYKEDRRL